MLAEIKEQHPHTEKLLQVATYLVKLHLTKRIAYRSASNNFMAKLLQQGVSRELFARALAQAWLNGQDSFEVPRRSRWLLVHSMAVHLVLALGVAISIISVSIRVLRHVNPELDTYLITIPPLLAMLGSVLTAMAYMGITRLVSLLPNAYSGNGDSS